MGATAVSTSDGAGSEELEGPQSALLVGHLQLHVRVHGEVDGGERDVSQETCLSTLHTTHTCAQFSPIHWTDHKCQ